MTGRKHVTALGVPFDMAAMRAKNEKVRAVGNMNVNARGDIIDSNNKVIHDVTKRVNMMYERTMQQTKPAAVPAQPKAQPQAKPIAKEASERELMDLDDDIPNPKK